MNKEHLIQEVKKMIDIDLALLEYDNDIISYINNNIEQEILALNFDEESRTVVIDDGDRIKNHFIYKKECFLSLDLAKAWNVNKRNDINDTIKDSIRKSLIMRNIK